MTSRQQYRPWQRLQQLIQPRPIQPEHSLRLRLYVQALVSVGIIATDVTSADAADALGISFWA
ncbi:MAG: hypothetical protein AAF289_03210, partial [Cyanobacteria bacterium P01_A01_bin.135]